VDMETGIRAYVLTSDKKFLEPYDNAQKPIDDDLEQLEVELEAKPVASKLLEDIITRAKQWREYADSVKTSVESGQDAKSLVTTGRGKELMDTVRNSIRQLVGAETNLKQQQSHTARVTAVVVLSTSLGICIFVGFLSAFLVRKQLLAVAG